MSDGSLVVFVYPTCIPGSIYSRPRLSIKAFGFPQTHYPTNYNVKPAKFRLLKSTKPYSNLEFKNRTYLVFRRPPRRCEFHGVVVDLSIIERSSDTRTARNRFPVSSHHLPRSSDWTPNPPTCFRAALHGKTAQYPTDGEPKVSVLHSCQKMTRYKNVMMHLQAALRCGTKLKQNYIPAINNKPFRGWGDVCAFSKRLLFKGKISSYLAMQQFIESNID